MPECRLQRLGFVDAKRAQRLLVELSQLEKRATLLRERQAELQALSLEAIEKARAIIELSEGLMDRQNFRVKNRR